MWTTDSESHFDAHFTEYMGLLAPLFDLRDPCSVTELFEYICCLIQPSGVEGLDENPLLESTALIDDLSAFSRQDMPAHDFSHPRRTQARLALLSYCHLTEADFFYQLLVNLLRVKVGERWALSPFYDLGRPVGKKSADAGKRIPATPNHKIARVSDYAVGFGVFQFLLGRFFAGGAYLLLMILSFWRYFDQRWKSTQIACGYLIALEDLEMTRAARIGPTVELD